MKSFKCHTKKGLRFYYIFYLIKTNVARKSNITKYIPHLNTTYKLYKALISFAQG